MRILYGLVTAVVAVVILWWLVGRWGTDNIERLTATSPEVLVELQGGAGSLTLAFAGAKETVKVRLERKNDLAADYRLLILTDGQYLKKGSALSLFTDARSAGNELVCGNCDLYRLPYIWKIERH